VCVLVKVYVHSCTHTHAYTHTHAHTHAHMHTCTCTHAQVVHWVWSVNGWLSYFQYPGGDQGGNGKGWHLFRSGMIDYAGSGARSSWFTVLGSWWQD